jgi:hypothetical protein
LDDAPAPRGGGSIEEGLATRNVEADSMVFTAVKWAGTQEGGGAEVCVLGQARILGNRE